VAMILEKSGRLQRNCWLAESPAPIDRIVNRLYARA
jgi:hypothetical protein